MNESTLNYIPESIKLTDFRYQSKKIKKKLLEEKRVLLLMERSRQLALLIPIDFLKIKSPLLKPAKTPLKMSWPAFHLGKIKIPLNRRQIYEAY